ncbi:MAG TPA: DUF2339 domain-containing protein, partial [Burkholderiaceae bacterium]|nr:DUF2339 domain-containing protein [Burkholderiaceae bacterium]
MSWILLLAGAFFAWNIEDGTGARGFGLVVFALVVGLLLQRMQRRIDALRTEVAELKAGPMQERARGMVPAETAPLAEPPASLPDEGPPAAASARIPSPPASSPGPIPESDVSTPALAIEEHALRITGSIGETMLAWFRGGNAIVRLGVVILFIGVAFLLRFAAEHTRIPIELRLTGVALGAIALVAIGWRLRVRRPGYGVSLQGAGAGLLYLVIFAALRLYDLLPPVLAFTLLAALSVLTALLAMLQNALPLAVLGFSGGFLAPVFASSGQGSHVALFSYYLVLNLGIAWVASRKAWKLLNLVGFVLTFVIGAAWGWAAYRPELFWSTEPFLVLHFALYLYVSVQYSRQLLAAPGSAPQARVPYVDGGLLFGLPFVTFGLQAGLVRHLPYGLAVSSAALSGIYLLLGRWLWRQGGASMRLLTEGMLALGLVFLVLVTPLALDARWTGAAWAVQGAGVLWIALRQQRGWAALLGLMLQLAAAVAFWSVDRPFHAAPFANPHLLGALLLGLSALVSARLLRQAARGEAFAWPGAARPLPAETIIGIHWLMLVLGCVQVLAGIWLEWRQVDAPSLDAGWRVALMFSIAAIVLESLKRRLRWPELSLPARVLTAFALLTSASSVLDRLWLADSLFTRLTAGWGWLELTLVAGTAAWLLHRLDHDEPGGNEEERASRSLALEHLLLGWYLMWQGGVGLYAIAARLIARHEAWTPLAAIVPPTLFAWWIAERLSKARWPAAAHPLAWSRGLLLPWLALLLLWSLLANLLLDGSMQPLSYVPLLNPVDLGHGLALLYALRVWRVGCAPGRVLAPVASVAGFCWVTSILVRTLHHWAGTPMWLHGALHRSVVQAGLTLLWTAIALVAMLFAARRASPRFARSVWISG